MTGPAFWTILLLAVPAFSAVPAPASAAPCTAIPTEIVVRTSHETVRDDTVPRSELDRIGRRLGQRHAGLERRLEERGYRLEGTPGLTEFTLRSDGRFEFQIRREGDRVCVSTSRITVELGAVSTIHIASEYPPESCEHDATLEHERQHADLNERFVRSLADPFRLDLRRALRTSSVSGRVQESERLQQRLADAAADAIEKATEQAMDGLGRRQETIDTEAEYIRLSRTCRNW
jgi:hypothetical protein